MGAEAEVQAGSGDHQFNFDSRWTYARFWKISVPIYHPRIGRYIPNEDQARLIEVTTRKIWHHLEDLLLKYGEDFEPQGVKLALGSRSGIELWAVANVSDFEPGKRKVRGPINLVPYNKMDLDPHNLKAPHYIIPLLFDPTKLDKTHPGKIALKPEQLIQLEDELKGAYYYPTTVNRPTNLAIPDENYPEWFSNGV